MAEMIINKVAESGIITLDLEMYYPKQAFEIFDMKEYLFMGLILKEKDFRQSLKTADLSRFKDKIALIGCSADAIIPVWAYMLVSSALNGIARESLLLNEEQAVELIILREIDKIDPSLYLDKRVVIKGCGEKKIPATAYVSVTDKLRPVVKSIMYGEPCSTVPVFKKSNIRD
ncbi:MAG: DUF2480 family protein [Chitinophagaceae bacterium]|nr:DUF2480 family protein [Bacteroidota bacterium]MCC6256997.1 DUF2480 family protein [Chitinophagaceae bacterium]